eukprot:c7975_g1_i2.p1 GENE.c7975_g1_i2~~c7975_g1_i2.p1  ORF type:complete len:561 (+),score=158.40 c7975_g1_i2:45-1685(+)
MSDTENMSQATFESHKSDSKSDTSSVIDDSMDEVSSTISSVAESLGMVTLVCGTEVTVDFLNHLDQLLRQHLHMFRIVMDREAEIMRVNQARRVQELSPLFLGRTNRIPTAPTTAPTTAPSIPQTLPSPVRAVRSNPSPAATTSTTPAVTPTAVPVVSSPTVTSSTITSSSPTVAVASPSITTTTTTTAAETTASTSAAAAIVIASQSGNDVPVVHSELRSLSRRGLVTALNSQFRSRLESIVNVQATEGVSAAHLPSSRATVSSGISSVVAPPPPPSASTVPSAVVIPEQPQPRLDSLEPSVRVPDQTFVERLLPAVPTFDPDGRDTSSELVALLDFQVTSRVLSSRFRDRLESMLRERMNRERIQPVRLSIPVASAPRSRTAAPTPVPSPAPQALNPALDTTQPMSMPPPLPRPYGNSTDSALSRVSSEIVQLRAQMDEMRRTMQASLQMQMEVQRMMSQEIASMFHMLRQQPIPHNQQQQVSAGNPLAAGKCVVCAENDSDVVFFRCGHVCTCLTCAHLCKSQSKVCPICRAPIQEFIRAYRV